MSGVLQACRTLHGWLGVFVLPWVVIIGATGLYLNHNRLFSPMFSQEDFSESGLEKSLLAQPVDRKKARRIGQAQWPDEPIIKITRKSYHGRPSYFVKKASGNVIVSISTGHFYLKTRYTRRTYSKDGDPLHTKLYWKRALKDLHETGWLGGSLGTWLADITAVAMMVFGLTGLFMWSAPRLRWVRRRSMARSGLPAHHG